MTKEKRTQLYGIAPGSVPSPFDRRRLTVASLGLDERTILRAYADPRSVRESTLLRLRQAAQELGLPPPPERGEDADEET
jgi:hypothetical protein